MLLSLLRCSALRGARAKRVTLRRCAPRVRTRAAALSTDACACCARSGSSRHAPRRSACGARLRSHTARFTLLRAPALPCARATVLSGRRSTRGCRWACARSRRTPSHPRWTQTRLARSLLHRRRRCAPPARRAPRRRRCRPLTGTRQAARQPPRRAGCAVHVKRSTLISADVCALADHHCASKLHARARAVAGPDAGAARVAALAAAGARCCSNSLDTQSDACCPQAARQAAADAGAANDVATLTAELAYEARLGARCHPRVSL